MRATVTFEDGKIVCVQKAKKEGQKSTKVELLNHRLQVFYSVFILQSTREMNGADELIYTMTIDGSDIVCVQKFKRI